MRKLLKDNFTVNALIGHLEICFKTNQFGKFTQYT